MFRRLAFFEKLIDEPEEALGVRPLARLPESRARGVTSGFAREMQSRDVLVVSDGKLFVCRSKSRIGGSSFPSRSDAVILAVAFRATVNW